MPFRLRTLPPLFRLALTGLLLALGIGLVASARHLVWHYENRDDQKGFTLDDVRAAYHGLNAPPKLLTSLQRGHPESLKPDARDLLIKWVQSGRINEDYENIDLGIASPRELLAANCAQCHSARAAADARTPPAAAAVRLDTLEDIHKLAFARTVQPNSEKIVVMSMHAHALSMATMSIVLVALACCTRLPRALVGPLAAIHGLALPADLAAWWLARASEPLVNVIVIAGGIYNATFALLLVLILLDLWSPTRISPRGGDVIPKG